MFGIVFATFWAVVLIVTCLYQYYESKQISRLIEEHQKLWNEIKKDLKDNEKDDAYLSFIENLPNTPHGKGYPLE